jgi:hypothetical protein
MTHDEFNSGAKHGFNMALYAIRNVDRQINYPETHGKLGEIPWREQYIKYNAEKDLLYKIYESIKKQQESD